MTKKELMKKAHQMTKEIKTQYPKVDYKFQFGLCLSFLINKDETEMEEKKLEGSEKQAKWATEIREVVVECAKKDVEKAQARYNEKQNKARGNKLNTAKETLEMLENETSAKFFIENFRTVLSRKQRCEKAGIESDHAAEYAFWLKKYRKIILIKKDGTNVPQIWKEK